MIRVEYFESDSCCRKTFLKLRVPWLQQEERRLFVTTGVNNNEL